ncbi:MAG: helix-turn-helix domain-containing protein [Comamonas sp.]|jgi:hypothetical protein|uniref:helix-turn-helix domain-containing protein n=1 Tax=Comamonas sp. TaxID=34028 RepID=UPI0028208095|nr:helix-turn-helix domain-containing protein [Comamonas sp.]MDR0216167.1 helix-turn-helix domain-containing protein [Comamonas sp.]
MNAVFDRYPNGGGEMLLALALADHASDDGTRVFPSIRGLAEKTRQSERSVQYQLRRMQEAGWLILVNAGNGGRGMHSEYRISNEWIKGEEIAPLKNGATDEQKGANDDAKGCKTEQERVQRVAPTSNRHRTVNEPSGTVADGNAVPAKAKTSGRATVLPDDFRPGEAAEQIAQDFGLDIFGEQAAFEDHHAAKGTTFKDWQAAFRTWLRNGHKFSQRPPKRTVAGHGPANKHAGAGAAIFDGVFE